MSWNSSSTQALLDHMNTSSSLNMFLTTEQELELLDLMDQDEAESAEKTDKVVLIGKSKTKRVKDKCTAYIWRHRGDDIDMVVCGAACVGEFCKRHTGPVTRRQKEPPIPAEGDSTLVRKHWAPTKNEIDDESYKPIYHDEATDQYFVPWFAPGATFAHAFAKQITEMEQAIIDGMAGGPPAMGSIQLSRFPSKKYGKVPKAMKDQLGTWDPEIAEYITEMCAWQV